jgi:hypothetical protein
MALRLQQPLDDGLGIALAALHGISFQRRDEDARQICPPRLTGEHGDRERQSRHDLSGMLISRATSPAMHHRKQEAP